MPGTMPGTEVVSVFSEPLPSQDPTPMEEILGTQFQHVFPDGKNRVLTLNRILTVVWNLQEKVNAVENTLKKLPTVETFQTWEQRIKQWETEINWPEKVKWEQQVATLEKFVGAPQTPFGIKDLFTQVREVKKELKPLTEARQVADRPELFPPVPPYRPPPTTNTGGGGNVKSRATPPSLVDPINGSTNISMPNDI